MTDLIGFDTETYRFGLANMAPKVVCLSWAEGNDCGVMLRRDVAPWLGPRLEKAAVGGPKLLGHHTAYDMGCLFESVPEVAPAIWKAYDAGGVLCTQTSEKVLDIADGKLKLTVDEATGDFKRANYGLQDLCARVLKFHLEKDATPRLEYARLDDVPIDQWTEAERDYPMGDAGATLMIGEKQLERAATMDYRVFPREAARQARYALALHLTSCWGLAVDNERARTLQGLLTTRLEELRGHLTAAGVFSKKGSKSMQAIRDLIVAAWPGGDPPKTDKGAIKTGAEVLEACAEAATLDEEAAAKHPLHLLVDFNRAQKMLSTYVDRLCVEPVVHPRYDLADTGRTTCSNPNIQNQPRGLKGFPFGVRECFMARPGHVLISVDYDSQELRTLAQAQMAIVGRSTLASRYQADPSYDPHVDFAAMLLGISYKDALARKKAGDKQIKEMRQRAKAANFGFPGGMGATKFRKYARGYGVELSEAEAVELRLRWFAQWPEMQQYFDHIQQVTRNGAGTITQLFSGRRRGQCGFSDGANCYFQGLASDISKTALYEVVRRCYGDERSPLYGTRAVAFIHDEILLEAPEAFAHEAAEELTKVMIEAMQFWTPDVPAKASPALMRHWTKDAEEARDKSGRLIAWEDRS